MGQVVRRRAEGIGTVKMTKAFLAYFFIMHVVMALWMGAIGWYAYTALWDIWAPPIAALLGGIAIIIGICIKHLFEVCAHWRKL